jgi:invasion protein IalB
MMVRDRLGAVAERLPSARRSLLAALAVLSAAVLCHGAALAQGAVKSVHGDWQIRCETPPGAQSEHQKSRLMRVQVPLGVLLPAGLGLKVDQADVGRAGYVRCLPRGCYAEVVMDDALVSKMKTGQTATFFIFQTPEEGIGFPMGLKGFGEGYDKLP